MQRASQIIGNITAASKRRKDADPLLDQEQVVKAAWARAVGKKVAQHTEVGHLVRGKLIVSTTDAIWQRNLFFLSRQILRNLADALGPDVVTDIEFRILPLRKEPQRAAAAFALSSEAPPAAPDEADQIQDPGMRRLYRAARKRDIA